MSCWTCYWVQSRVAVEKLFVSKLEKMKLRQDALYAIFSDRKTFSIPKSWPFGMKSEFFNTHDDFTAIIR
jgi:hypothetical protein